jgi:hypothetical protein
MQEQHERNDNGETIFLLLDDVDDDDPVACTYKGDV